LIVIGGHWWSLNAEKMTREAQMTINDIRRLADK